MLQAVVNWLDKCQASLLAAGFVSNSYGVGPNEEGVGEVVVISLLGGFCGLIGGLIVTQVMRYLTFVSGRNLGGHVWTVIGAFLGVAVFAVIALAGGED